MRKYVLPLVICLAMMSCNNKERAAKFEQLAKAEFLIGQWEHKSAEGTLTETWAKVNDSLYHGQAYFIRGTDTLHQEQIELKQEGSVLSYIPTVEGQNNDKPVRFNLSSSEGNKLVFENPAHNYPQKIVYFKKGNDSLVAEISGVQQGKTSIERFKMGKAE